MSKVRTRFAPSRGLGTAIDFSLSLIRQLEGSAKAEEIAESVVYSTEKFY